MAVNSVCLKCKIESLHGRMHLFSAARLYLGTFSVIIYFHLVLHMWNCNRNLSLMSSIVCLQSWCALFSSVLIKLAGHRPITVVILCHKCAYLCATYWIYLNITRVNFMFEHGTMWASNFPEIFYTGNMFYLIIQFIVLTNGFYYATLVWMLHTYHIKHTILLPRCHIGM